MNDSYGSEGEYIGQKRRRAGDNMGNGDGSRATWDMIFKISQIAVLPLLAAMFYLMMQMNNMDRRLAIIEVTTRNPQVDASMIQKLAILEERQNRNVAKVDAIEEEVRRHRENSTYDPLGNRNRLIR